MEDLVLANALSHRSAYDAVMRTGHHENLRDNGAALWTVIDDWYQRDKDVMSVNLELFKQRVAQVYPQTYELLHDLVDSLQGKASPNNFAEALLESRRQIYREQMTMRLLENDEDSFREALVAYDGLQSHQAEQRTFSGSAVGELLEVVEDGNRIPLATSALNRKIRGGMLPGHHATLFGRPEAGKSLFGINSLVSACSSGYVGGFWENEDPIVVTQLRAAQCICNATEDEIRQGGPATERRLEAAGWYDRMHFRDSPGGSLYELERWVDEMHLDFLVVNQLPGIRVKGDNRVLELDSISKGLRAIGKTTGTAVLSITQAGDSGEGKRILQMGDIDWSNTAIQAACDLLIGFGVDEELKMEHKRCLSLCKNKLGNDHNAVLISIDENRHVID